MYHDTMMGGSTKSLYFIIMMGWHHLLESAGIHTHWVLTGYLFGFI